MSYENLNQGAAFEKEGFKGRSGTLNVEGVEYWVSLFENTSKNGKRYTKIQLKKKETKLDKMREEYNHSGFDDSAPF